MIQKQKARSDLSTAVQGLCVGRVYRQGFIAIFQGFVWSEETELSERKVQKERKQSSPDRLLLCIALCLPVPQQCNCLCLYNITYFYLYQYTNMSPL